MGKSTLVRRFAAEHGLTLIEVNLERHLPMDDVFKTLDVGKIALELEGLTGRPLRSENALLFLDEVQATLHAIAALRYFYEEMPDLPVIAAGSLLEFALSRKAFSMPVGRDTSIWARLPSASSWSRSSPNWSGGARRPGASRPCRRRIDRRPKGRKTETLNFQLSTERPGIERPSFKIRFRRS